jgi:hypothetical protein
MRCVVVPYPISPPFFAAVAAARTHVHMCGCIAIRAHIGHATCTLDHSRPRLKLVCCGSVRHCNTSNGVVTTLLALAAR